MTYTQIMVLAMPVFLALITVEWWVGRRRGHDTYRLHDAMSSIGLGMVSQLANFLTRVVGFGIYAWSAVNSHCGNCRRTQPGCG